MVRDLAKMDVLWTSRDNVETEGRMHGCFLAWAQQDPCSLRSTTWHATCQHGRCDHNIGRTCRGSWEARWPCTNHFDLIGWIRTATTWLLSSLSQPTIWLGSLCIYFNTTMSKLGDFDAVRKDIASILKKKGYDDGSIGPVLVRLAWHASGTYSKEDETGGSNGAGMRYEEEGGDPANAGLENARAFLEPIKEKHPWITYADLWTLAGVVAIKEMDGPEIEWKPGRTDFTNKRYVPPRGRLPDGAQGQDHLRHIFYRMGFNDQEIVALTGAHNLGRCHKNRSGFDGPWVVNPTRFSNTFYKFLLNLKWEPRKWDGPFQYSAYAPGMDEDDEPLMMLPTDYSLVQDEKFRPWVEKYAADRDLFYADFAKAFAKLIELGVYRDEDGIARCDKRDAKGSYIPAPKKSSSTGARPNL